ncbi:MAG: VWA domain-containing protein [Oscillospiraceae bacterium]|nr:VWA domain-containing protein [Oscillospiraceae bacterium]
MTELVFILDRSGSMYGLEQDTIGGFNSMLAKQKTDSSEAYVTTVLFDNRLRVLHDRLPLQDVKPMTDADYTVGGSTALLDAVGSTIQHIARIHKYAHPDHKPTKTLFVIITDGMENASRQYTYDKVKALISHEQEKYGWEFLFLGANIDAAAEGARFGIAADRAVTYKSDEEGTQLNYEVLSETVSCLRAGAPIEAHWSERIQADVKKRGR